MARQTIPAEWANAAAPSEIVAPTSGKQNAGWGAEKPPYENFNWAWQLFTNMLQNAEQLGIMEWKTDTEYQQWGLCIATDGAVYQSQLASNQGNDPTTDDGTNWEKYVSAGIPYLHARDKKANGTTGDSISASTWTKLTLNDIVENGISGASIATSQITLLAGTYRIRASTNIRVALNGTYHAKTRLRNITDGTTAAVGQSQGSGGDFNQNSPCTLVGGFTITGTKVFEIQGWASYSGTIGIATTSGEDEIYTDVGLSKIE